ncbi:integral membrane protein [Pseudanabaena sp. lw0831]|uniref:UPF0182 family protein n=1 Tax=Pseudanabaena sp. lw0831 TaxID=1357935 RepID=UPI0019159548|nr:UPF0182 family protein [Pseudanabaena sp. lw0831]GBO51911.1 integral membrane protein [Pseudanabaena sp. lw0831]
MKLISAKLTTFNLSKRYYLWILLGIAGLVLTSEIVARLGAEILWFQEMGYLSMYLLRITWQIGLGSAVFAIALVYLFRNLQTAETLKYADLPSDAERRQSKMRKRASPNQHLNKQQAISAKYIPTSLRLRWLLPLVLSLSFLICLLIIHYGQVAIAQWRPSVIQPSIAPIAPLLFRPDLIGQLVVHTLRERLSAVVTIGLAIALLVYPKFLLRAIAVLLSAFTAWVISRQWMRIIPSFQSTSFGPTEPVFNQDISFYIFNLPTLEVVEFGLVGICLYVFIAVFLTYLLSGNSLSEGKFIGISHDQQRHLYELGGVVMLVIGFSYWLNRYELLYSPRGVSYGASYTDNVVQLPVYTGLSILALAIAIYLILRWIRFHRQPVSRKPVVAVLILYLTMAIGLGEGLPIAVQSLIVQPNELAREQPYIQRTISFTRQAFGLESISSQVFNPQGKLTEKSIQNNDLTVRNIRLWDKQPLLATNRQLQQIRLYYSFPDADIDRYTINEEKLSKSPASQQQVLIAARELDYAAVPQEAQTWVNQHLIYTHGYGFTLSPVNRVAAGGLPEYFIKDIGITEGTPLTTSSEAVRTSIPIGQPRIYYGENTDTYVMTGTKVKELDYPSDNDNVYNIYDGRGGLALDSWWRRMLFAKYLNDWRMAVTPEFQPETKLLFRRNIMQRIKAIAPFLRYDSDPYLVAASTKTQANDPSSLYWIVDAYTTSDRYPYSDIGKEGLNYIRNSIKVVIDAYHGNVNFYIAEPSDPIIHTWAKIFPDLFKPMSAMPEALRQHLRYPVDLFSIQSERLMTYHMTDAQVFYNREDQWQIPNEVYGDQPRLVEPYYLITSLPEVPFEEFILLLPFTPKERTNLVAWMAARSDGENYGKLLLYTFPKQILVYGPEQIEARINQDPVISQQISLWNRQGSRVIQGNLLIIPIEQSLLYVEPLYLESTQNKLPTLVRVIVAYENRIVMAQTLQQAIAAIFKPDPEITPPIIRPVETPTLQP